MRSKLLAAVTLAAWPAIAAAAPSDVNAQAFYADAKALEAKGMAAMFDKRLKPMMAQMEDAGARSRAQNLAAKAQGKPLYCVPDAKKKGMSSREVIALLGRVPEAERRSSTLFEVWKRALGREYPCG